MSVFCRQVREQDISVDGTCLNGECILIEVHAGFRILTPFGGEDREIVSTYPVTDTVIVGTVPERYTYIGGSGSDLLGEIRDYEENSDISHEIGK